MFVSVKVVWKFLWLKGWVLCMLMMLVVLFLIIEVVGFLMMVMWLKSFLGRKFMLIFWLVLFELMWLVEVDVIGVLLSRMWVKLVFRL